MEKYDVLAVVGEGSYGLVMRCRHRESGQLVAIKKFLETEDDPIVKKMALREIRMLKKLRHDNLVSMIEVFRRKRRYFLVFEYMERTVLEELDEASSSMGNSSRGLGAERSREYIYQVLRALTFMHSKHQVIHRDIKPENVLVSKLGVVKLCDFGFARLISDPQEPLTEYVATRWYRSPELLVSDPQYGKEVDVWALGCLYAEMMTGEPLFPGDSDIDQLHQIVRVLGAPTSQHRSLIARNQIMHSLIPTQFKPAIGLEKLFPRWTRDQLDFLSSCLRMDGNQRPTADQLMVHLLFTREHFDIHFLRALESKVEQQARQNPLLMDARRRSGTSGTSKNLQTNENGPTKMGSSRYKVDDVLKDNNQNKRNPINNHISHQLSREHPLNMNSLKLYLQQKSQLKPTKPQKAISFGMRVQAPSPTLQCNEPDDQPEIDGDPDSSPPPPTDDPVAHNMNNTRRRRFSPLVFVPPKQHITPKTQNMQSIHIPARQRAEYPHLYSISPRLLHAPSLPAQPMVGSTPPWLTANVKVLTQGRTTQIGRRQFTDWKSVSTTKADDSKLLPNCPGAFITPSAEGKTISTSPYTQHPRNKKLSPMKGKLLIDHHSPQTNLSASSTH